MVSTNLVMRSRHLIILIDMNLCTSDGDGLVKLLRLKPESRGAYPKSKLV
jgi:hypothetical protein